MIILHHSARSGILVLADTVFVHVDLQVVVAVAAVPAEDRHNLDDIFAKFDQHFGVYRFRSIKRQEFLRSTGRPKQYNELYIRSLISSKTL